MTTHDITDKTWHGKHLKVNILFSRAGLAQQIVVQNDNGWIIVDTGDGTLRDLLQNRVSLSKLMGILFTHGHFDHIGGLHTLLGFLRMVGRKDHLPLVIPEGCVEVIGIVDNFAGIYGESIPFEIELLEVGPRKAFGIAGMSIEPFPVIHCGSIEGGAILDRIPAFGYRISYKNESVAISGDTGDCPELRELVKDADLAVIEATYAKSSDAAKEELAKVHLSEELATEIGSSAREYILVHKGKR